MMVELIQTGEISKQNSSVGKHALTRQKRIKDEIEAAMNETSELQTESDINSRMDDSVVEYPV